VEGVDNKNACYGATNALFNAIHWIESKSWDGRYAMVVAADIAVYKPGPARPTGGCGAVAMLIGPNAPIVLESGLRGSYFDHVYDFYKPELNSEYPIVVGDYSNQCYLTALDECYESYSKKFEKIYNQDFSLQDIDYFLFHTPYNKLLMKSFARLFFKDELKYNNENKYDYSEIQNNKILESNLIKKSNPSYTEKVEPGTLLSKELGNLYCASIYCGLISLIHNKRDELIGKRITFFSYGSGLTSSMFSFRITQSIEYIADRINIDYYLLHRLFVHPEDFNNSLKLREKRYGSNNYEPSDSLDTLFPGSYYLEKVNENYCQIYNRLPKNLPKL